MNVRAHSTSSIADRGSNPRAPVRSSSRSAAFAYDQRFQRIVAALHDAALDDSAWSRAFALIDDACLTHSSHLAVVATRAGAPEYLFGTWLGHGVSLDALAREYVERYFPIDERVSRLLLMPAGSLLHNADLFTEEERATSATYNRFLPRWGIENQVSARLAALDGSHVLWTVSRSRAQGDWRPSHLGVLARLLPHLCGAVRVRQALAKADARAAALEPLLDASPRSVILLDRRGQVMRTNARAARLLADGRLLCERGGALHATTAAEDERLGRLLARACCPRGDGGPRAGVMRVGDDAEIRLTPVTVPRMDFGARRVAAVATTS